MRDLPANAFRVPSHLLAPPGGSLQILWDGGKNSQVNKTRWLCDFVFHSPAIYLIIFIRGNRRSIGNRGSSERRGPRPMLSASRVGGKQIDRHGRGRADDRGIDQSV